MDITRGKEIRTKVGLLMFGYPGGFKLEEVIKILSEELQIEDKSERNLLINVLADILDSNSFLTVRNDHVYTREISFYQNI